MKRGSLLSTPGGPAVCVIGTVGFIGVMTAGLAVDQQLALWAGPRTFAAGLLLPGLLIPLILYLNSYENVGRGHTASSRLLRRVVPYLVGEPLRGCGCLGADSVKTESTPFARAYRTGATTTFYAYALQTRRCKECGRSYEESRPLSYVKKRPAYVAVQEHDALGKSYDDGAVVWAEDAPDVHIALEEDDRVGWVELHESP